MIIKHGGDARHRRDGEMGHMELVGSVTGCDCIIVDDIIDTGRTLCAAANELLSYGARRVFSFATHGLFHGDCAEAIEAAPVEEGVVSNTIPLSADVLRSCTKIRQVSVGKLLAEAISCIHTGASVSSLFDPSKATALLA